MALHNLLLQSHAADAYYQFLVNSSVNKWFPASSIFHIDLTFKPLTFSFTYKTLTSIPRKNTIKNARNKEKI